MSDFAAALDEAVEAVLALAEVCGESGPYEQQVAELAAVAHLAEVVGELHDRLQADLYDATYRQYGTHTVALDDGSVVEVSRSKSGTKYDGRRLVAALASRMADELGVVVVTDDGEPIPPGPFVETVCGRLAEATGLYRPSHSFAKGATEALLGDGRLSGFVLEDGQAGRKRAKVTHG